MHKPESELVDISSRENSLPSIRVQQSVGEDTRESGGNFRETRKHFHQPIREFKMLPIVIVACLATMAMSAPTDTRPTTIIADEPEVRLLEAEEPGKGVWGYISSETADGQVELKTIDGKTITTRLNQLPVSPAFLPGVYPYPMSPIAPGYDYRYFPENTFPAYYPFYQQGQYDFDGNLETKSDVKEQSEVVNGDGTRQTPPVPTPNPFAPFFNTLIALNNLQMAALTAANIAMLVVG